jgi:hypothetical protein
MEKGAGDCGPSKRDRQPFLFACPLLQPVRPLPRLSSEATKKGAVTPHPRYPGQ